jgi:ferrochelatase
MNETTPIATETATPLPASAAAAVVESAAVAVLDHSALGTEDQQAVAELPTKDAPAMGLGGVPASDESTTLAAPGEAASSKIGVLLVNLGTPDTADPSGVRRYLREFLSDHRVIEKQGPLWQAVLHGIILRTRPRRKAHAYRKIWNNEQNESPLKTITRAQAEKLSALFAPFGSGLVVDWAMRYGNPSIATRLVDLVKRGCDRVVVMPLYPQYSASTTATVADEVFRVLMRLRRQPAIRIAAPYYADDAYIGALAASIRAELGKLAFEPDVIVASFHGMPRAYINKGDPYYEQCVTTVRLLREQLGLDENKLILTFQSRFGRGKWLEPATDRTIRKLAKRGGKNIVIVTPGFSADCLETLEEIAIENGRMFRKKGGQNYHAIPCLNDSDRGMAMLGQLVLRELKGWIPDQ